MKPNAHSIKITSCSVLALMITITRNTKEVLRIAKLLNSQKDIIYVFNEYEKRQDTKFVSLPLGFSQCRILGHSKVNNFKCFLCKQRLSPTCYLEVFKSSHIELLTYHLNMTTLLIQLGPQKLIDQ